MLVALLQEPSLWGLECWQDGSLFHFHTVLSVLWTTAGRPVTVVNFSWSNHCELLLHCLTVDMEASPPRLSLNNVSREHTSLVFSVPHNGASPDGWAVWGVVVFTCWWLLVDHCVLRNWDRILVRAVKGLISRAGMVSICPLLWQRDVKLPTNQTST